MVLNKEQSQIFLDAYMSRYSQEWETSLQCSNRIINEWIVSTEEEELSWFTNTLREILWKQANKLYKKREQWNETMLTKCVNSLRLNYWPKILTSNTN